MVLNFIEANGIRFIRRYLRALARVCVCYKAFWSVLGIYIVNAATRTLTD